MVEKYWNIIEMFSLQSEIDLLRRFMVIYDLWRFETDSQHSIQDIGEVVIVRLADDQLSHLKAISDFIQGGVVPPAPTHRVDIVKYPKINYKRVLSPLLLVSI